MVATRSNWWPPNVVPPMALIFACFRYHGGSPPFACIPDFVDCIGENADDQRVSLNILATTVSVDDAITFLYPNEVLNEPEVCLHRAFLSPRNVFVDDFNETILERLPGNTSM